jgi:hypothetical protein
MGVAQQLVSVEEHMHSSYEPDAEYMEGRIIPRPAPRKPHSKVHGYQRVDKDLFRAGEIAVDLSRC